TDAKVTSAAIAEGDRRQLAYLAEQFGTPVLVGIDRAVFLAGERGKTDLPSYRAYNSATLVDRDGKIVGIYDKIHRVMFGEYIPFANWLPFLYRLTPLSGGIEAGDSPV